MEALLPRFRAAHTQVLGVSVDSIYSHANWGRDLGGISFPLLADFNPKGAVAASFGVYLNEAGITDRATIIIDRDGIVRHASSVTPAGERDPKELAALCEGIDREFGSGLADFPTPEGVPGGTQLFVKNQCGFSRAALLAVDNLHLRDALKVKNVTEDAAAAEELSKTVGSDQAPALIQGGEVIQDSSEIIRFLVSRATNLAG